MRAYLKLDVPLVAAFIFTVRDKDYGGIHLGLASSSMSVLLALANELATMPAGHSRSVPLLPVGDGLPKRIAPRNRHLVLTSLRIGSSVSSGTSIHVDNRAGNVALSSVGLEEFRSAVMLAHGGRGDLLMAGDSGTWTDRLWFWPLEN